MILCSLIECYIFEDCDSFVVLFENIVMKKEPSSLLKLTLVLSFLLMAFCFSFLSFKSDPEIEHHASEVKEVSGIPVFIMSEPKASYIVVDYYTTEGMMSVGCPSIREQVSYIMDKALRHKKKVPFDAIIFDGSTKGNAIKWKRAGQ